MGQQKDSSSTRRKRVNVEKLIFNGIIVLIVAYLAISLVKQEIAIRKYKAQIENLKLKIEAENKEIKKIKSEMKTADSIENVERIARERLKMVKPGEIMYVDVNSEQP